MMPRMITQMTVEFIQEQLSNTLFIIIMSFIYIFILHVDHTFLMLMLLGQQLIQSTEFSIKRSLSGEETSRTTTPHESKSVT